MSDLARLEAAAAGLESLPEDTEAADYVGRLDRVIRTLQGHRKTIMDELPGPVSGREYRIVEERYSERSYNTRLLLSDFGLHYDTDKLVEMDVVRLSWQWTKMRNLAIKEDIGLRIAGHEVDPASGEADHVGEVWKSRYKVEGIK
jgi:hypothetical protein